MMYSTKHNSCQGLQAVIIEPVLYILQQMRLVSDGCLISPGCLRLSYCLIFLR